MAHMGKRILLMVGLVGAAVLLIVGVAAAAGGPAPSEPASTSSSLQASDTTLEQTSTAIETTDTTAVMSEDTTTTVMSEDTATTELEDGDNSPAAHPANFGGTISSLRHAGDHTPAAVVKGKTVPGWTKKHPETTTTTTVEVPVES